MTPAVSTLATLEKVLAQDVGAQQYQFGEGFTVATSAGAPTTVDLDTAFLSFRVPPPAAPGAAVDPISGVPYGTGAWAVSASLPLALFVTVPDGAGGFVWAMTYLATSWAIAPTP